jgi:hypothetical protein
MNKIFSVLLIVIMTGTVTAGEIDEAGILKSLDETKSAYSTRDYQRMWQELDKVTTWLEVNAPRSGLGWQQAKELITNWVKKNWHEDVTDVKPLSEGGMETTTERHQGSFMGYSWYTGEKTVTTDFVFEARVKADKPTGKKGDYKIRFHFDKGPAGWFIKRAGVM